MTQHSARPSAVDSSTAPRPVLPRWLFRLRGVLVAPPVLLALLLPPAAAGARGASWIGAVVLVLLGTAIRIWAQQHLFYRIKERKILTTTGPYRHLRNPFYVGNALLSSGAVAACEVPWLIPLAFAWAVLIYFLVIDYEEARLRARHGDPYQAFLDEVPRWIPRIRRLETRSMFTPMLGRALVKELHCLLILAPAACKVLWWSTL